MRLKLLAPSPMLIGRPTRKILAEAESGPFSQDLRHTDFIAAQMCAAIGATTSGLIWICSG
ncbi:hypothetical protein V2P20_20200 [Methylobacter sp. Wu1]|uniref:hypothetical protein n=1 Tax=Methylobacter sp. Wu1 TaxID=3119359 RepID=UPI002F959484